MVTWDAQQEAADRVVEHILATRLLDASWLASVLKKLAAGRPAREGDRKKIARQREKLEAERQRLLRMTLKGTCTEDDYDREYKRIAEEASALDLVAPPPAAAAFDAATVVVHITRTFARFRKLPFEKKRDLLRTAVCRIVLEDRAITAIVLQSAFFGVC